MSTVDLYGKSLPVVFVEGYTSIFEDMMGRSNAMSYFQGPAQNLFPDREAAKQWLMPLYAYFRHNSPDRRPLDYRYVSLFEQGLRDSFLSREQIVMNITRDIGKRWWYGFPPGHFLRDDTSLKFLLSRDIIDRLNTLKPPFKSQNTPLPSRELLIKFGTLTFIKLLSAKSGMSYHVSQYDCSMEVRIDVCPFCLNQSNLCRVSFGIIEAFMEWIHGKNQSNALPSIFGVNETNSTGHIITIEKY